ncbi:MAG: hypothetical protein R2854_03500 [Caldilineaceae bacterium]
MAPKIAIIGGGSAYAPGLIHAFIQEAAAFQGAELALMDLAAEQLETVAALARKMAAAAGADLTITATTDRRAGRGRGLRADHLPPGRLCRATWTSPFRSNTASSARRPSAPAASFSPCARCRSSAACWRRWRNWRPRLVLVNYSNPTQIVAEAVTHFNRVPCISICDQSRDDQKTILHALGRPDAQVVLESVGLNHATWSTRFEIDGEDGVTVMARALDTVLARDDVSARTKRQFRLAAEYGRLPNSYMQYYYFRDETVADAQAAPQTRAEAIMDAMPGYYAHFQAQLAAETPELTHVRGGSLFGDMAVDVLRGLVQQDGSIHTLNVPNRGALPDFAPDRVVEVPARLERRGATPLAQDPLPAAVTGLLKMLAEYQWLAAEAIWQGDRRALDRALAANPLVLSLPLARRLLDAVIPLQAEYVDARFR